MSPKQPPMEMPDISNDLARRPKASAFRALSNNAFNDEPATAPAKAPVLEPPMQQAQPAASTPPAPTAAVGQGTGLGAWAHAQQQARPTRTTKRVGVDLPDYLADELNLASRQRGVQIRYLLLEALRNQGYHVDEADFVIDRRKIK